MRIRSLTRISLAVCLAVSPLKAELTAELADIAARLDYGYYTASPDVLRAARIELQRMPDDSQTDYHRALAALRTAQLSGTEQALDDCLTHASRVTRADAAHIEAWILVAACASLAGRAQPLKLIFHQRRRDQALEAARRIDAQNARLAWVNAWVEGHETEFEGIQLQVAERHLLEPVVRAYRLGGGVPDGSSWGEAEALAHLGAACMRDGDRRRARDLLEEALLVAPDYSLALKLLAKIR